MRTLSTTTNGDEQPEHLGVLAARVTALSSLAVAAPLLDVLGANPTFFTAHDVGGWGLALFGVTVVIAPALVFVAVLIGVRLIAPRLLPTAVAGIVGILVALCVVPIVDRTVRMSTPIFTVAAIGMASLSALTYHRWRGLREYTTLLSPAPALLLVLFLVVSPASALLKDGPRALDAGVRGPNAPVVVVVFDELPLGALLDDRGNIDGTRFPGFHRLASTSTWYSEAVTVSPWTHLAVPSILTGLRPSSSVPVAAAHPRSLFTLLGRSHRVHSVEPITEICPTDLCGVEPDVETTVEDDSLTADTSIVFLHSLLPDDLAAKWLPALGARWSGFDEEIDETHETAVPSTVPDDDATAPNSYDDFRFLELSRFLGAQDQQLASFAEFLSDIRPSRSRPGLWFDHTLLPHLPYRYLPDGRTYSDPDLPAHNPNETWVADEDIVANAAQRLVLQTQVVDGLVSSMLDHLVDHGMFDDALVIVTADHGVTFEPGKGARGTEPAEDSVLEALSARGRDEVLPIPLFVKYPGQHVGTIDDRDAQIIDIVPTIVDSFDLVLPKEWAFDGQSLLAESPREQLLLYTSDNDGQVTTEVEGGIDAREMAAYFQRILGPASDSHDPYRLGPFGDVVGASARSIATGEAVGSVLIERAVEYDAVDPNGVVPALFQAEVSGVSADDWIAVAVNGTVAGTGPAYPAGGRMRTIVTLDPALLRAGRNIVEAFRIDGSESLRPLSRR